MQHVARAPCRGERLEDPQGFTLTKWYLDCATDDGRACIAYWVSLAWHTLSLTWQNVAVFCPDGSRSQRSSLARASAPLVREGGISWPDTLGSHIEIAPCARPIEARLYECASGCVDWRAEAPAAMVDAEFHELGRIAGPGYVERIVMTVPPWRLPIRELRWGRWVDASARRSVVWIDWRGREPQTRVFVDGTCAPDPVVRDDAINAGTSTLTIGATHTLHERSLEDIVATIPPLRALVPARLLALRQSKWCSAAGLSVGNGQPVSGRAIHEKVVFG